MAGFGLAGLPAEIQYMICSFLGEQHLPKKTTSIAACLDTDLTTWNQEQVALSRLIRSCRALRAVAEPFLYCCLYTATHRKLFLFVRTLSERPDLAPNVQQVVLAHNLRHELLIHRLDTPTLPHRLTDDGIESELGQSNTRTQAYAELLSSLLQLTTNLICAHLCLSGGESAPLEALASSHLDLRLLKWLTLEISEHGLLLDDIGTIITIAPNLDMLHCIGCKEVNKSSHVSVGRRPLNESLSLQNLTELILVDSCLTSASLDNLLSAVGPKLTKFGMQLKKRLFGSSAPDHVRFNEAITSLQPWTRTLSELKFHTYGMEHPGIRANMQPLQIFKSLDILHADAASFDFYNRRDALTSFLPPSIREIRIWGYSDLALALDGLLEAFVAGRFSRLTKVSIDDQEYEEDSPAAKDLADVNAALVSVGVEYIIHAQLPEYLRA